MNSETGAFAYHALVDDALRFAARAHARQTRKGTDVPYIVHPVGVMLALLEAGITDPELLAAALLHDTVEDTGTPLAELRAQFGARVAAVVEGCSEPDKSDTWEHRKQHTIDYLKQAPRDVALVSAADKLHNLRSLIADEAVLGEQLWGRFKRGRAEVAWYYRSLTLSLQAGPAGAHPIVSRLAEAVTLFFGG